MAEFADHDWSNDVARTQGKPGAHWLGDTEVSNLPARFHLHPVQDPKASEEKGHPVFVDRLHITILQPGGDSVCRPVRETDQYRFPGAWKAWEQNEETPLEGTPLEEWPQMTPATILTMKANNVFTVEQILKLSDAQCEAIGPIAFAFREKAREYIARAEGQNTELDAVKAQNAEMAEQLRVMQEQIAKMTAPKKRGRPRKVTNEPTDDHTGRGGPSEPSEA